MPESMVVLERVHAAKREQLRQIKRDSSVDPKDEKQLEMAREWSEDEYLKGALRTEVVDRKGQILALQEYEKANRERQRSSGNRPVSDPFNHYEPIPGARDDPPPYSRHPISNPRGAQRQVSATTTPSTATSSAQARKHAYDSPDRSRKDLLKMREHRSVQDEYLSGHGQGHLSAPAPLQHQRSMPGSSVDDHAPVLQPPHQPDDPHYYNIPILPTGGQHQESAHAHPAGHDYMNFPAQHGDQHLREHELQNLAQQGRYPDNPPIGGAYQNPPQPGSAYRPDHYQDPSRARDPRYQQNQDNRDNQDYRDNRDYRDIRNYPDNRGYRDNRDYQGDQGYQRVQGYAGDQGYLQDQHGVAGGPTPPTRPPQGYPPGSAVPQPNLQYPSAQSRDMHHPSGMKPPLGIHQGGGQQHQGVQYQPGMDQQGGHPGTQWPSAGPQGLGTSPPRQQHGYGDGQHGGEYRDLALAQGGNTVAFTARPTISHSFSMGSTVQLTSDPARCGVIQWIGTLPDIHGQIAGVELVSGT